ncbi:MAG: DUF1674 domain-containing protein [Gammaproteobacteria bacterium]|nr:DUF1674 domain-containing protein [Gammaproteobacteria bacterium]
MQVCSEEDETGGHSESPVTKSGHESSSSGKSGVQGQERKQLEQKDGQEIGGRKGPDPTRYGDWEKNGRCIDF